MAPGALDTDELEELRARAREADPREAGRLLRQGLALWRGPPYADLRYEEALQPEIRRLEELRLATLEERIEADLAAGEASQLVGRAGSAGRRAPHRERLRGFLMLALYRSGRQAEALETYQQGRQLLDSELGLEPGPELKGAGAARSSPRTRRSTAHSEQSDAKRGDAQAHWWRLEGCCCSRPR